MISNSFKAGIQGSRQPIVSLNYGTYGWNNRFFINPVSDLRHYPRLRQLGQYDRLFSNIDGNFHIKLKILSKHLDVADDKAIELLAETSPNTANVEWLLEEWELLCGIKNPSLAVISRRNAVIAALRARGGLSKPYFRKLAEGLGFNYGQSAAIPFIYFLEGDNFKAFRADISKAGDKVWDVIEERSVVIAGTQVENNSVLKSLFNRLKPVGIRFVYRNE